MKKRIFVLFFAALLLAACSRQSESSIQEAVLPLREAGHSASSTGASCSFEGTVFGYAGQEYDISTRNESVNAIMSCTPVGQYIVIEGHAGPKNAVYSIFNTETASFEPDICGCDLILYNDDIKTAVYSFWENIYTYDGELLASLPLSEYEMIYDLEFTEDHAEVMATIISDEGGNRVETIEIYKRENL